MRDKFPEGATTPVTVSAHGPSREQVLILILKSRHPPVINELVPVNYLEVLALPLLLFFVSKVLGKVVMQSFQTITTSILVLI